MTLIQLLQDIKGEFPEFVVRSKESSLFMRLLSVFLRIITLGAQKSFMTDYITTIGYTIYVPNTWETTSEEGRQIVLRHERVHMRQRRKYGAVFFTLLYLIPFFPLGLAYWRAIFEWEAYEETLVATSELFSPLTIKDPIFRERIIQHFVSGAYGWMWPFRKTIERWYDNALVRISDRGTNGQA